MNEMIILRGLSGAGKTTWQRIHRPRVVICTTEAFFKPGDRTLQFSHASAACFKAAIQAVESGTPSIIIDNTNTSVAEVAPYVALAEAFGYSWSVLTIHADIDRAWNRNVHGTPWSSMARMKARMDAFDPPTWWWHQGRIEDVRGSVYTPEELAETIRREA